MTLCLDLDHLCAWTKINFKHIRSLYIPSFQQHISQHNHYIIAIFQKLARPIKFIQILHDLDFKKSLDSIAMAQLVYDLKVYFTMGMQ